ncbi:MAG: 50S ribosomal protein L31 [Rhodospirillales bacterium]|nr:50S ribosomal protein L31 [Alphaproteobacteria bacterium]MCB9987413.1 50S ribosomal protein L31 [Rhodospirillales bacterium]USO07605.1 MAG: 50S ribosomal protein L31 [Rhodospirillales bacterium]
MKQDIHPDYHKIKIVMTDGSEYDTYSTWGAEGEVMKLDIDPKSHPAWTGGERRVMEKGQLSKFEKRFAGFGAVGGAAKDGTKGK